MTLILTASCKDGVCVCADKLYRFGGGSEPFRFEDNHLKIYEFGDASLIIFNHGVNKFGNRYWDSFCSEYDRSNRWKGKNLKQVVDDFKIFVESSVRAELKQSKIAHQAGFVLCGKGDNDSTFGTIELFWSFDFGEVKSQTISHQNFARTGDGKQYLEALIKSSEKYNSPKFWENRRVKEVKSELKKLFRIAVSRKKAAGGEEFSDKFDIKCVAD